MIIKENFQGVGRTRISIETNKMERIKEELEVDIIGQIYEVALVEECFHNGCEFESAFFQNLATEDSRGSQMCGEEVGSSEKNQTS